MPDTGGQPVAAVGIASEGDGAIYLDYLTWDGEPDMVLQRPPGTKDLANSPGMWRRAWVNGVDQWNPYFPEAYNLAQNTGRGLLIHGTRQWRDYTVSADIRPSLLQAGGVALRVQGIRRYYALLLCAGGSLRLVKMLDEEQVLAERTFGWQEERTYTLRLQAEGSRLRAWLDDVLLFDLEDAENGLASGAAGLVIEEGHMACDAVAVCQS